MLELMKNQTFQEVAHDTFMNFLQEEYQNDLAASRGRKLKSIGPQVEEPIKAVGRATINTWSGLADRYMMVFWVLLVK